MYFTLFNTYQGVPRLPSRASPGLPPDAIAFNDSPDRRAEGAWAARPDGAPEPGA